MVNFFKTRIRYPILLFVSLILFFGDSWLLPITDPTECCYTLTAKEMILADDWISPRIYGNFWYDKPIMFYWELILAYKIFGFGEFTSRFFPAIFATLGLYVTYFFCKKIYNEKIGFTASLILATSLEYWYLAHAIITDMTLMIMFALTLMSFYLGYRTNNPKIYLVSFIAAGMGVLTKGPIAFFLPGLIIIIFLAWQRDLKHLRKLFCIKNFVVMLGIISIWYLPMFLLHGMDFVENFLGVHNFLRATVSEYPKTDVWYYYTVISLIGFFPWSLSLLPVAVKKIFCLVKQFHFEDKMPTLNMNEKFLIVWAMTVVIFFQLCATKYLTYTLPAMSPVVILIARYFVNRSKIFLGISLSTLILFQLLIKFVAVPLAEDASNKLTAEKILPLIDDETCIVSHSNGYSGSLVFYTEKKIYRLETAENFAKIRPQKMSWKSKNVMPFMTFDELPDNKNILAIVSYDQEEQFLANVSGEWDLVGEIPKNDLANFVEKIFHGRCVQTIKSKIYRRNSLASKNRRL